MKGAGEVAFATMLVKAAFEFLACLLLSSGLVWCQVAGDGVIQGTVSDSTGAVVAGATVTATNVATGVVTSRTSTEAGYYVLSAMQPGEYTVSAAAPGFQTTVQEHVIVNAVSVVSLDLSLHVGAATQQITVTAAPPLLNTSNGTLGLTMPGSEYAALPLEMNGGPKSPSSFIYLMPGVQAGNGFVGNINGGPAFSTELYVNGLPIINPQLSGDNTVLGQTSSTEVIEQFQVITNGTPAYYSGQGTQNYVIKSGTNQYHGDAYWYVRNTMFDSRGFFVPTTPVEIQNEGGFTAGGPVKKDRLFLFGGYDLWRLRSTTASVGGLVPSNLATVPTAAMRQGDFSALPYAIYDPSTTACNVAGACTRQAFEGNIIPMNEISSISQFFQSQGLPATTNGSLTNNYLIPLQPSGNNQYQWTVRADWNISEKNHLYYLSQNGVNTTASGIAGVLPPPYTNGSNFYTGTRLNQVNDAYNISPTLLNVFAAEYMDHPSVRTLLTLGGDWPVKAGLKGLPPGIASEAFPNITFAGPNAPTQWAAQNNAVESFSQSDTVAVQDNLEWVHGKHSLTVGGQLLDFGQNGGGPNSFVGGLGFSNNETAGFSPTGTLLTTTGSAYASFLLGLVDSSSLSINADGSNDVGDRNKNIAIWVQDDWKFTPRLTFNLGLRYEIFTPYEEAFNRMSWLNPLLPNPALGGFPGALQFAGYGPDSCLCRTFVTTHYKNFAPRIGMAYQLNNKTALRASFGTFYFPGGALGGNASNTGTGLLGYSATPSFTSLNGGISPAFNWNNGFPGYTPPPFFDPTLNTGFNTTTPQGGAIAFGDPTLSGRSPYTENWHFTVERQISPSTLLSLSYSGSATHFVTTGVGRGIYSDQILPKYLALGNLLLAPYTPANLASAQAMFPEIHLPYANYQGSIGQMMTLFPQYATATDEWPNIGNDNYHSFQLSLQRRFSHGLQFLISFTGSKEMDDAGSVLGNIAGFYGAGNRTAYDNHLEYSTGTQDIPKQLAITYVYQLPFGKGHRFGGGNKVVSALASGWQFSGIQTYTQGTPLGVIGASCITPYVGAGSLGSNACYANYNPSFNGPVRINGSYGSGNILGPTPPTFLNVNAFENPAPFTFGSTPRTLAYNLRNIPVFNENFALRREIQVWEHYRLSIAVDAFNAFNRVQFDAPNDVISSGSFGLVSGQANQPRVFEFDTKFLF
jgi:hypothetical protein